MMNKNMFSIFQASYLVEEGVHVNHGPHFSHDWRRAGRGKMLKKICILIIIVVLKIKISLSCIWLTVLRGSSSAKTAS